MEIPKRPALTFIRFMYFLFHFPYVSQKICCQSSFPKYFMCKTRMQANMNLTVLCQLSTKLPQSVCPSRPRCTRLTTACLLIVLVAFVPTITKAEGPDRGVRNTSHQYPEKRTPNGPSEAQQHMVTPSSLDKSTKSLGQTNSNPKEIGDGNR